MSQNTLVEKHFTVGDRRTALADTLQDANGTAINLTGHTVELKVVSDAGTVIINFAAATVDTAASGYVSYAFSAGDATALIAGTYWYWWRITRTSDGLKETFPADGRLRKLVMVTPG